MRQPLLLITIDAPALWLVREHRDGDEPLAKSEFELHRDERKFVPTSPLANVVNARGRRLTSALSIICCGSSPPVKGLIKYDTRCKENEYSISLSQVRTHGLQRSRNLLTDGRHDKAEMSVRRERAYRRIYQRP